MLAAFFNVPAKPTEPVNPKKPRKPRQKAKAVKAENVEPFDLCEGGTMHARFQPPAERGEPSGIINSYMLEAEPVDAQAPDPYEYLWQEANNVPQEEDDTDSCITFDDDVSEATEQLSTSPVDCALDVYDRPFLSKRKAKASEVPVYSGPELWFEDDDFIE